MPRKRVVKKRGVNKHVIRKHSVTANMHVVELTRAGTSLDLEIMRRMKRSARCYRPGRIAFVERREATKLAANSAA